MSDHVDNLNEGDRILEYVTQNGPHSSRFSPVTRALYGIDPFQQTGALPLHKDGYGLVFFTRPELNLSTENIQNDRRLALLVTNEETSINNYVRCMLDPYLQIGGDDRPIRCPLVDPHQAFIPILTNTCQSLSGLRDVAPPTYTSAEGQYRESMSFVDGPSIDYTTYDIQASFRNIIGNIVTRMMFVWTHYASLCFDGTLVSRPDYWLDNEVDYNTRIFKISLDPNKEYVTQISSTITFPLNSPVGASGNFENNTPFNSSNDQVSISFRAHGYETYDNILIEEFNACVIYRNDAMRDGRREGNMVLLDRALINIFKNRAYPRINPGTSRLEWWVFREDYHRVMTGNMEAR